MNINGIIPIFKKKRGTFSFFEGSISRKDKDGKYTNCSIEVRFGNKDKFSQESLDSMEENYCFTIDVKSGFISVDSWEDKATKQTRRKLVLVITNATILNKTKIDEKKLKANKTENGLPF